MGRQNPHLLRPVLHQILKLALVKTAREHAMMPVHELVRLLPRHDEFAGIGDDDVIPVIHYRKKGLKRKRHTHTDM